jgi:hypothetical protein
VLFVSFWQLGNRQILDNYLLPLQTRDSIVRSGHDLLQEVRDMQPFQPDFLPFALMCVMVLYWLVTFFLSSQKIEVTESEEGLVNYFEALSQESKDDMISTENHFYKHYKLSKFGFRQFKRLTESKIAPINKRIEGIPTYRILDNPIYKSRMNYIEPLHVEHSVDELA